ncbi:NAD-dependent epimerase/dehydratase family protein [Haloarchaeobius sp. DT45]|uniref:NAD-dependent epimerase/dehydratase family protein n=1 Tax=Haloarchaeobius sp. DT45 TaxID=3446116 RepID=UPI003F6D21CF
MSVSEKRILITGGAGFIGSQTVREFLERGADVLVVDDCSTGSAELVDTRADLETLDLTDADLEDVFTHFDPDVLVHLAAIHYIPYCNENPEEAVDVNCLGTRRLLDAARSVSLDNFVFASSAAVYPPRADPNTEDSELNPMDIYGKTKLLGEDIVELFEKETGVPSAAARLFNVYGPNETNMHLIPAVLEQVLEEDEAIELGNLSPCRDFVHVSDVARAFRMLVENHDDGFEAYNVGTGAEHSVQEVAEFFVTASGKDLRIEQAQERVRESDRPHLLADIKKIRTEIGWEPTVDFQDGAKDLFENPGHLP